MTKADLQLLLPALRRFAYSLTGSRADADDLTQNTLVRLLDHPTPDGVPAAQWAFRICRNLWIDEYRARRVRQTAQPQVEYETLTETDGEAQLLNDIQLTQVGKALDTLPPEQREVLSLVAVEGMSYQEAASVLAIPAGTIMSRLARARLAIANKLKLPGGLTCN